MMRRHNLPRLMGAALGILAALPLPAAAQGELRSIVVPSEGGVVIPPRSAPRLAARPAAASLPAAAAPLAGNPVMLPDTGVGLAAPLLGLALPAIAGAVLGGALAGSKGGGTSAPARTR